MPLDVAQNYVPGAAEIADRKRHRLRLVLMIAGPLVVLIAGLAWYLLSGGVSTDNAYIQADMAAISADR